MFWLDVVFPLLYMFSAVTLIEF